MTKAKCSNTSNGLPSAWAVIFFYDFFTITTCIVVLGICIINLCNHLTCYKFHMCKISLYQIMSMNIIFTCESVIYIPFLCFWLIWACRLGLDLYSLWQYGHVCLKLKWDSTCLFIIDLSLSSFPHWLHCHITPRSLDTDVMQSSTMSSIAEIWRMV